MEQDKEESGMSEALALLTAEIVMLRASRKPVPRELHEKLLQLELHGEDVQNALGSMQGGTILINYRGYALIRAREIKNSFNISKSDVSTPTSDEAEVEASAILSLNGIHNSLDASLDVDLTETFLPEELHSVVALRNINFFHPDEFGFSGWRRVDSLIGRLFQLHNRWLTAQLVRHVDRQIRMENKLGRA